MDSDKDVVSDSDSFVIVSDDNSVGSDCDNSVGSDSENYVIVGHANSVASHSGEDVFDESKQQLKNVDNDSYVGTDSEDDLSDESKPQLKNVVNNSNVGAASKEDLSDDSKQQLKNMDNDSNVSTNSEDDLSDERKTQLKNVDSGSYVSTDSDDLPDEKNVDNDSSVCTDSVDDLSNESKQKLKNVNVSTDSEDLSDGSGKQLKNEDDDSYASTDYEDDLFDGSGEQLNFINNGNYQLKMKYCTNKFDRYPCKRIGVVNDCFEFPEDKTRNKKMNINDVTMEHVLPFLPAKALCRLRTVSKEWDQWIGSSFFIHKQTYYFKDISGLFCLVPGASPFFISLDNDAYGIPRPGFSFLPEPVTVKTTCNGLICCQSWDGEDTYYICNPVNKQWKKLPKSGYYHGPECFLALAFEPSVLNFANDFELVCAFSVTGHSGVYFDIYSSKSSTWKLSKTVCYELEAVNLNDNGLFLKGVVCWETSTGAILAFDLKESQYGMLPLPFSTRSQGAMAEMNGELCYILPREEDGQYTLEIYGDMDMSLKRTIYLFHEMFNNDAGGLKVLACVKDDAVLLLLGSTLIAYHVKAGEVEWLRRSYDAWTEAGYAKYFPYVNSLVEIL